VSKESRRASRNARAAGRQPSSGPSGASRAGRRERVRHIETKQPFLQRYRVAIIGVVIVLAIAGFVLRRSGGGSRPATR